MNHTLDGIVDYCEACNSPIPAEKVQRGEVTGSAARCCSIKCGNRIRKREQRKRERLKREAAMRLRRLRSAEAGAIENAPLMAIYDEDDGNDVLRILRDDSRSHHHGKSLARAGLRGGVTTIA